MTFPSSGTLSSTASSKVDALPMIPDDETNSNFDLNLRLSFRKLEVLNSMKFEALAFHPKYLDFVV